MLQPSSPPFEQLERRLLGVQEAVDGDECVGYVGDRDHVEGGARSGRDGDAVPDGQVLGEQVATVLDLATGTAARLVVQPRQVHLRPHVPDGRAEHVGRTRSRQRDPGACATQGGERDELPSVDVVEPTPVPALGVGTVP
ncbi:hypothetical protein ASC77_13920 [Nocardioides sp. Root1257]|uniref:hypothetical protein n=1 Tax=unclassified Nocardioides TaxID=2615069 RepID=UPI0006F9E984|nr:MULTISPECIES: hypothetical protein [unclassified Nocardioides]KQW47544.1 hypothetical protein ASC77_13920 [Nocardioides sp. Root1257]KRC45700.1 hypothetical protein ASE24_13925 [Nocardioides sp. Root224]